jgi:hypothetical protein
MRSANPAALLTIPRRGVSETIGLGRSSPREQSRREELGRRKPSSAPGPRNLDWSLVDSRRIFGPGASNDATPPESVSARATGRTSSRDRRIRSACSRVNFGCRSRRTELGPRGDASGLASGHARGNLGCTRREWAPEAASRRRSRENGGGFLFQGSLATPPGLGAFVDGRRSDLNEPAALTRRRGRRVWLSVETGQACAGEAERDRGRQR